VLHRSRALQRVNPKDETGREIVDQVLNMYLPRSLYFLSTLLNKIDGAPMPDNQRRCLQALLVSALDEGNTMWHASGGRTRPRQLNTPQPFRENNLWLAMEEAVGLWSTSKEQALEITRYPDLPKGESGICLYPGRFRKLEELPQNFKIQGAACIFPRPNQAFWTLSAVWSGWLWGPDAVQPLKGSLERRRYDWNWYAPALFSTLRAVKSHLPNIPVFGVLPEVESGFMEGTFAASAFAALAFEGAAMREEDEIAQLHWSAGPLPHTKHGRKRNRTWEWLCVQLSRQRWKEPTSLPAINS